MWSLIKKYLEKLACSHNWKVCDKVSIYEYSNSKLPYKIIKYYVCTKCGKIKKINL